jgi:hypothetical protein
MKQRSVCTKWENVETVFKCVEWLQGRAASDEMAGRIVECYRLESFALAIEALLRGCCLMPEDKKPKPAEGNEPF